MTDLDTGPSSIRDDSICESSLPPNKSSGDIGERLKRQGEGSDGYRTVFNGLLLDAAAEIERLGRENVDKAKAWDALAEKSAEIARLKAFLSDAGHETIQSEQAWKRRALTAESAVAAAWEEAAKIAEDTPTTVSMFLTKREADAATLTKLSIASAIRTAVSKKTAESGHSPSTQSTRTK